MGRHVGAGFGRRPSISRRISPNSRRGIATSAIWKVTLAFDGGRLSSIAGVGHAPALMSDDQIAVVRDWLAGAAAGA